VVVVIPEPPIVWSTVIILVASSYTVTVATPDADKAELPEITSPVLIPTTESRVIVVIPARTGCVTVLSLVRSPKCRIGSFNVDVVEFTDVVVPSTCKLPLIITVPSLLKPSGYGSINRRSPHPASVSITLELIPTHPNLPLPVTLRLVS